MFLKKIFSIAAFAFCIANVQAQIQPYQIYTINGKKTSFEKMMKELNKTDVVLFGELHNNAIAHYLQVKVAKTLFENKEKQLIIGAEMFERDQAEILQNYVKGNLDEKEFEEQ